MPSHSAGATQPDLVLPPALVLPALRITPAVAAPDLGPVSSSLGEWRDARGRVTARGRLHTRGVWMELVSIGHYFWAGDDTAVAIPAPETSDDQVTDYFARAVLPLLLQVQGLQSLHASAVTAAGGVVAFCGTSGMGKSTTVAALSALGFPVWADDVVAFWPDGPVIRSPRLPAFSLRLLPDAHGRFSPSLAGPATRSASVSLPLVAVVELSRREGPPVLEPLAAGAAVTTVLEHAYCFSLDHVRARRRLSEAHLALAEAVPVFRLGFEPGLDRIGPMLDLLVAHFRAADRRGE